MRLILIIIIIAIIIVTGLGLGVSILLTMNPQTSFTGYLLMIFSGIGVLVNSLNLWTLISKEIKLEFGKITKDNNNRYFIRVQQKGERVYGKGPNVEPRHTLENMKYEYTPYVWADEKKKVAKIREHEDLF